MRIHRYSSQYITSAPGTVEGLAMIENILENIARKLKKDPLEIRLANLDASGEMVKLLPDFIKSVGNKLRLNDFLNFSLKLLFP